MEIEIGMRERSLLAGIGVMCFVAASLLLQCPVFAAGSAQKGLKITAMGGDIGESKRLYSIEVTNLQRRVATTVVQILPVGPAGCFDQPIRGPGEREGGLFELSLRPGGRAYFFERHDFSNAAGDPACAIGYRLWPKDSKHPTSSGRFSAVVARQAGLNRFPVDPEVHSSVLRNDLTGNLSIALQIVNTSNRGMDVRVIPGDLVGCNSMSLDQETPDNLAWSDRFHLDPGATALRFARARSLSHAEQPSHCIWQIAIEVDDAVRKGLAISMQPDGSFKNNRDTLGF